MSVPNHIKITRFVYETDATPDRAEIQTLTNPYKTNHFSNGWAHNVLASVFQHRLTGDRLVSRATGFVVLTGLHRYFFCVF
jgi:hypothetical protein